MTNKTAVRKVINRTAHVVTISLLLSLSIVSCKSTEADKIAQIQESQSSPFSRQPLPIPEEAIKVTYPSGAAIPASSTFIAGAVTAGTGLSCNGAAVHVSPQGFFAHVVPLKPGDNSFLLVQQPTGNQRVLTIKREIPQPPISAGVFKIDAEQLQPNNDRGVVIGDLIEFSAKATPEAEVVVTLGKRKVILRPASAVSRAAAAGRHRKSVKATVAPSGVNQGLDAAYGKVYQRRSASPPDLYVGFYKVQPDDQWKDLQPKFTLNHAGKSKSIFGNAKLTTIAQPFLAETLHTDTIVRVGPGAGRTTPLSNGVRFFVDGWQGDQIRCSFAPSHHFWIKKDDLNFEPGSIESGAAPNSVARTINVGNDEYGSTVTIPLSQRLPFQIEQRLKPNELILRVFGVTADTDWITPAYSHPGLVDKVFCKQAADGIYEVQVPIKSSRQWGFKADYDDTNLVLHIKHAPRLSKNVDTLQGLSICVDPGHGGKETGAIGCSGIKEANINLGIAMKLKTLLENAGAKVTMTRVSDKEVSLDERVEIANKAQVDVLLSVHNNSLPDGRDPLTEHGTSSYWYHPQSIGLAHAINTGMVQDVGFPDFGSRFQNLALTRPSGMLACLAEVGFVINPEEYAVIISPEGQQRAAEGLLKGLIAYLHPPAPVKH
ncbi:N-acetylmuramoyl-L-alanine amidase [soil metagenome]